jgi:hypothetical protein
LCYLAWYYEYSRHFFHSPNRQIVPLPNGVLLGLGAHIHGSDPGAYVAIERLWRNSIGASFYLRNRTPSGIQAAAQGSRLAVGYMVQSIASTGFSSSLFFCVEFS